MDALVISPESAVNTALQSARAAAVGWRSSQFSQRLGIVRRFRHHLAADPAAIAATLGDRRPLADTLAAEVLPLLAGARFLEQRAGRILAPHRLRGRRPLWLTGVSAEIRREPCGVVLILSPSNYPLFLPGSQILQALVAGNAVCVKPAPGCAAPLHALASALRLAGLPTNVLQVLDEAAATGAASARAGFDHIVLTGSAETGQKVLAAASESLTPATMELSGNDAVLVLPGADLDAVSDSLVYGLRLNGGATCIAPRRIFVTRTDAERLQQSLLARAARIAPASVPERIIRQLQDAVTDAVANGARLVAGGVRGCEVSPMILTDATPSMRLLQQDVFAPWLALVPVADVEAALAGMDVCPYALGASVFGPLAEARIVAGRVRAGSVCVNDLIMPTADPRLPFGGRGRSGFGLTRGAEGLLAMTVAKTVSLRRGRFRPHLMAPRDGDAERFAGLIGMLYGRPGRVLPALKKLLRPSMR